MSQEFEFEKFMDDICKKESVTNAENQVQEDESPQRKYRKLYRELWQNRIWYGKKK